MMGISQASNIQRPNNKAHSVSSHPTRVSDECRARRACVREAGRGDLCELLAMKRRNSPLYVFKGLAHVKEESS